MAQVYGQTRATRIQETAITCNSTSWTALEGATPLANRVGIELYNKGQAATAKLYLSYDNSVSVKLRKAIETGAYHFEPTGNGLTLYGRTQSATARIIVTEYGV